MSAKIRIYVSSRTLPVRVQMWLDLRARYTHWKFVSTWIDEAAPGATSDWPATWMRYIEEIRSADVLLLHAEAEDFPLKGALVEVGAALALGKSVLAVLPQGYDETTYRPVGSWVRHPAVRVLDTMSAALRLIRAAKP